MLELGELGRVEPEPGTFSLRDELALRLGLPAERLTSLDGRALASALTRLRDYESRLASQASRDELTGALRRGAGQTALERELARVQRSPEPRLVLVFVDVDGLKRVNDGQGHAAGDSLIRAVATGLRTRLRSYDLVIRWGGDEFVCGLGDVDADLAERALERIQEEVRVATGESFSFGLACWRSGRSLAELVAEADADLYARRRGIRG